MEQYVLLITNPLTLHILLLISLCVLSLLVDYRFVCFLSAKTSLIVICEAKPVMFFYPSCTLSSSFVKIHFNF